MVLDFLTPKWGHLKDDNGCITSHFSVKHGQMIFSEAHVLFQAGKNCDGYFTTNNLIKQVNFVINIFESKTNGTMTDLFLLDNAPSHWK